MSSERIHYLNGLRGVLAVIVFIHHFVYAFCPYICFGKYEQFVNDYWGLTRLIAYSPLNIIFNPGTAINFFFLLSGYVQSHHYFKTNDTVFLQKSAIKRYFRLAVPVLTVVILVFIFHKLHWIHKNYFPYNPVTGDWIKSMLPDNLSFFGSVKFALVDCFYGNPPKYYQVLWSMAPELYNSWMVLLLLFVTHKIKNKTGLLIFWIAAQALALQSFYSVSFTAGVLICHLTNEPGKFAAFFSRPVCKWLCLVVGLYFASYPFTGYENSAERSIYKPISFLDNHWLLSTYVLGNFLLFLVIINSARFKKLLSNPVLLYLGNISFMLYLTHLLITFSFSPLLYSKLAPHFSEIINLCLTALSSFLLIVAFSKLLTRFIDEPSVNFFNRQTKKIFGI